MNGNKNYDRVVDLLADVDDLKPDAVAAREHWEPLPHQTPPPGDWTGWLLLAGRGTGKTDAASNYINRHAQGPACLPGPTPHRIGIIAPTLGDARASCVYGDSGLRSHNPAVWFHHQEGEARWPNGSVARIFGAHTEADVDRLRAGGNRCVDWFEELAAWRRLDEGLDQAAFGRRLGPRPHWIASTTPKNRKRLKALTVDGAVTVTRAHTDDNPFLSESARRELYARYQGTRLGRQELAGELIEDVEGALWTTEMIERNRISDPPPLERVVVAVDPSGGAGEIGVVAVGVTAGRCSCDQPTSSLPHWVVLADRTLLASPAGWARAVVALYDETSADRVVGESNFGGDMVESTIRSVDRDVPYLGVRASRGKAVRAEPVAALYEQGRVHHTAGLEALGEELTTWEPGSDWSPNRLDALVWGVSALMRRGAADLGALAGGFAAVSEELSGASPNQPF